MVNTVLPCKPPKTNREKEWEYHEYYIGERDEEQRKNGFGTHHWSGPESLGTYTGSILRDTMHGVGEYRCRHRDIDDRDFTYEGHFYSNCFHGYGIMSYCNGRVFSGLYYNNLRWGPGVETFSDLRENVGLWRGTCLVRLAWVHPAASVCPDMLGSSYGREIAAQYRSMVIANTKMIGETNSALELLKQSGTKPFLAATKWPMLFSSNCNDRHSQFFHKDVFDKAYYNNAIETLEDFVPVAKINDEDEVEEKLSAQSVSEDINTTNKKPLKNSGSAIYYTWNNSKMMTHMMKHCFQHDKQAAKFGPNITLVLNGPRQSFRQPADHELFSRILLMASYLGHIKSVAQLINEKDVYPDVTDSLGNSAIMYAACGNQPDVIHFLVDAGAHVDNYNDACYTPLAAVLINYACSQLDIPPAKVIQAILPPNSEPKEGYSPSIIEDWKIERDSAKKDVENNSEKQANKVPKPPKSTIVVQSNNEFKEHENISGDKVSLINIYNEYTTIINESLNDKGYSEATDVPYIFEVKFMEVKPVIQIDPKKAKKKDHEKNKSKKAFKLAGSVSTVEQIVGVDSRELNKYERLDTMMTTIKCLLTHGADPRQVYCPQPALFIALMSTSPELIQLMIEHKADVNEAYPQAHGYTPIDIAVSGPMTSHNLEVIRTLLKNGAKMDHVLPVTDSSVDIRAKKISGPSLLHIVLDYKTEDPQEYEIQNQLLELLLKYGCDPMIQFKGDSAMDVAMSKSPKIFDIFVESPKTNLNAIINDFNQTILVKMFYPPYCSYMPISERLQKLTKLLLYGADPLLKCQNSDYTYDNLFAFASFKLLDMQKSNKQAPMEPVDIKKSNKGKAPSTTAKNVIGDYKQAISLVADCARLLYIRWLQAKLMLDLIQVQTPQLVLHNKRLQTWKRARALVKSSPLLRNMGRDENNKETNIRRQITSKICSLHCTFLFYED